MQFLFGSVTPSNLDLEQSLSLFEKKYACWILSTDKALPAIRNRVRFEGESVVL